MKKLDLKNNNENNVKQLTFKQHSSLFSTVNQFPTLSSANMTKSYTFNFSNALEYTCHRQLDKTTAYDFCGTCNSCQIIKYMNSLKQWFDRASHITIKKLLIGLVIRINNFKIYKYLNDLLKPIAESKDFVYARNKFLPSCDEDHLKPANNRCLDNDYVNRQVNYIWNWYSNSNNFIKQNFMLSILSKCEQVLVFQVIQQLRTILESAQANMNDIVKEDSLEYEEFKIRTEPETDMDEATCGYNSDTEIVCEAYDDEDDDDPMVKADEEVKSILNQPNQKSARSRNAKFIDFIRQLPVHLSKLILSKLDNKSLSRCLFVCKYWSTVVKEVKKEEHLQKLVQDDLLILKGTISRVSNPKYARNTDVRVVNLYPGTYECMKNDKENEVQTQYKCDSSWSNAYAGYYTRNVIMEERNVFCGPYNVLVLKERKDPFRVVHFNGKNIVSYASLNKNVFFIDTKTVAESDSRISGHAGTIKSIYICESKGIVVTGSYDTTIRVWSIESGKCLIIFQGHQDTVSCLSMYDFYGRIISGSSDKTCKIWNIGKNSCWRTFKHSYAVVSVAINEEFCVTGGSTGKIKLFYLLTGSLIKTISAHQGQVKSIKFDKWHILTASSDGYALAFSAQGKHKKCLIAMRHPKEVNCIEFQYMRAITGCSDGQVRIWNILNGDCLRIIRGNSRSDPILSMSIVGLKLLINTESSILLLEFEKIIYDFNVECVIETGFIDTSDNPKYNQKQYPRPKSYSQIRASRMELVSTPNPRLFNDNRQTIIDHSSRPVSGKCLNDARKIYSAVTRSGNTKLVSNNFRTNSAGHISEAALIKRRSIMESINAIISSQGSHHPNDSILSNYNKSSAELFNAKVAFNNNIAIVENQDLDVPKVKRTPANLGETKQYLRDQLLEIKKNAQFEKFNKYSSQIKDDTKSCVDGEVGNRLTQFYNNNKVLGFIKNEDDDYNTERPKSSPSRVRTKRIKLKAHQFRARLEGKTQVDDYDSDEDPIFRKPKTTHTFISKKFETQETELKTNTGMYPVNVKSRIPNPFSIRPQTCPTKKVEQLPPTFIGTFTNGESVQLRLNNAESKQQQHQNPVHTKKSTDLVRSKSAAVVPHLISPHTERQQSQRPRTGVNHLRNDLQPRLNETSQMETVIVSLKADNLNLKTYTEVDKVIKVINRGYTSTPPDLIREKQKDEIYKKFWHLKSIGQYHGSLLAKPKVMAPEIRE